MTTNNNRLLQNNDEDDEHVVLDLMESGDTSRMMHFPEDSTSRSSFSHGSGQDLPSIEVELPSREQHQRRSSTAVAAFLEEESGSLRRVLADAGRWAYGTVWVEFWVWNDNHTLLFRPPGAVWTDPVFHNAKDCKNHNVHNNQQQQQTQQAGRSTCPMCRLTNSAHPDYIPVTPVPAGVGLPGVLWTEQARGRRNEQQSVTWRNIPSLANDPDLPYHPRLQPVFGPSSSTASSFYGLELGWAAAVAVHRHDHSGLVIFMAREGVDRQRLQSQSNEDYLLAASDMIAATYFMRVPLLRVMTERRSELAATLRRAKNRILALRRLGINLEKLAQDNATAATDLSASGNPPQRRLCFWTLEGLFSCWRDSCGILLPMRKRFVSTVLKSRGGNAQPPPAMGWQQSLLTLFGCLVTLSILTRLNVLIEEELGDDFTLTLPLFGALMTLLFGLSSAPASQPRNIIIGQGLSMVIGIAFGHADSLTHWMRQTVSTSLAIAAMVKLGVTHPPGAAVALLFSSGEYGWKNLLFVMIGNIIAILCATAINNASEARQFPSYWGLVMCSTSSTVAHDGGATKRSKPIKSA